MRQHVGLIGGGFKPYTKGHHFLVEQAAQDNDEVYLFVSTGDRARKGQLPLYWKDMEQVWKVYLENILPGNVHVTYVPNPISAIYSKLEEAESDPSNQNSYTIYGDDSDMGKIFSPKRLQKHVERLHDNGQVMTKPFARADNVNISGTMMRKYLEEGDRQSFIEGLPAAAQKDGLAIFDLLSNPELEEDVSGSIEGEDISVTF